MESGRGIPSNSFDIASQHDRIQRKKQQKQQKQAQIDKYGMLLPNPNQIKTVRTGESIRHRIIENIAERIHLVQNAAHGEHRLRDLNDSINDLLKEKEKVEDKIKSLNGPDYRKLDEKFLEGRDIITVDGYHYFGAAKLLPGVNELLGKNYVSKSESKLDYKGIDGEYFGFNEYLELEKSEYEHENKWKKEIKQQFEKNYQQNYQISKESNSDNQYNTKQYTEDHLNQNDEKFIDNFPSDYPIPNIDDPFDFLDLDYNYLPSQEEMSSAILEARKREIISRIESMES